MRDERRLQRDARVIRTDRDALDVGGRRQIGWQIGVDRPGRHDGDPALAERVAGERRHVAARLQLDGAAGRNRPRLGLGDQLESAHAHEDSSTPMYGRLRWRSSKSRP